MAALIFEIFIKKKKVSKEREQKWSIQYIVFLFSVLFTPSLRYTGVNLYINKQPRVSWMNAGV